MSTIQVPVPTMTKKYPISEKKFSEAITLIKQNGGTINSDNTFEIQGVKGHFAKAQESITITVKKKPFFASWSKIEDKLDGFFSTP